MTALYNLIKVDPDTLDRLDTYDDEFNDVELERYLSCPDEIKIVRDGWKIYRFGDDWLSYICIQE